jgi:hypothetical protein
LKASIACSTHPEITATHAKTLEITTDAGITRRASCVVGVAASYDPGDLLALRGRIAVTIECGGTKELFEATVSPFFDGRGPLVFRRGPSLRGATFASQSEATAATLDRGLVERLRAANSDVSVTIETIEGAGSAATGVLHVACVAPGGELPADAAHLRDAVDVVVEDAPGRPGRAAADLARRLGNGGRVLLVVTAEPERLARSAVVVEAAYGAGAEVRAVPEAAEPETALLAAGCGEPGHVYVGALPKRAAERRRLLRGSLEAGLPCIAHGAPERVAAALADLATLEPGRTVTLTLSVRTVHERVLRGAAADVHTDLGSERSVEEGSRLVIAGKDWDGFGRDVVELVRALRREDVSERTLVLAVQRATGESRSAAYDLVRRTSEALGGEDEIPG